MKNDPAIEILSQRLADADIDPQLRDALADDLTWAADINGSTDPSMQGLKRLTISGVRRELLAADRERKMQNQVGNIIAVCSKRHSNEESAIQGDSATQSLGKVGAVLKILTLWRWPIAILGCSPYGLEVLKTVFHHYFGA